MSEIQSWRFLVSRNQFLDYRTVVAPDFMCQANIASLLAKAAEGDCTGDDSVYYREIYGSKVGDLTIIYRVNEAQASDIFSEIDGALKDSFGREIYLIQGIAVKGIQLSISVAFEDLELNHQQLIKDYRNFWEWVSPQPAIPSELGIFESVEKSSTLKRLDLPAYVISSKKEALLTKTSPSSSELKETRPSLPNDKMSIEIIPYKFDGEVHQCFFLNDTDIVVYLRPSTIPHAHKVTRLDLTTKHSTDLICGEFPKRSVERICLASDSKILVSSNKSIIGKDENSNLLTNLSFFPYFLKALNLSEKKESVIHEGGGELIAISKDCKWVANATDDALNPKLFDITGVGSRLLSGGHNKKITTLAASLYDNTFASGDESGFIRLWSFSTSDSIGGLTIFDSQCKSKIIDAIAFSPCNKLLVCSGNTGEIKVVEYKNNVVNKDSQKDIGTHYGTKGRKSKVNDLAFSPDGKRFASAGDDGSIILWDISKDQSQDGRLLSGHSKSVMSVSFSPDGKQLASGSKDKTVVIHQLS